MLYNGMKLRSPPFSMTLYFGCIVTIQYTDIYLCIHVAICDDTGVVPSLKGAANQLNILKKELKLYKVFLASDATEDGKKD